MLEQEFSLDKIIGNVRDAPSKVVLLFAEQEVLHKFGSLLSKDKYEVIKIEDSREDQAIKVIQQQEVAVIIHFINFLDKDNYKVLEEAIKVRPCATRVILSKEKDIHKIEKITHNYQIFQFMPLPFNEAWNLQIIKSAVDKYKLSKENEKLHHLIYSQHQQLTKSHNNLSHELKVGARIYEVLLSGQVPSGICSLSIDAMTVPSKEIDGDFYDFYRPSQSLLDVTIGDVMGKGLPAALIGTAIKNQLMKYGIFAGAPSGDFKSKVFNNNITLVEKIITDVHKELSYQLLDLGFFVCLIYGRFDLENRIFSYIDCGATKPIYYDSLLKKGKFLKGKNFPIGVLEKEEFFLEKVKYHTDDIFVFYSDGITETKSPEGELFGAERLLKIIEEEKEQSPSELLSIIKNKVISFGKCCFFDDDLTLIVIKIKQKEKIGLYSKTATFNSNLSSLKPLRQFIHYLCLKAPGDNESLSSSLQLAINEIFCNIVKHGYKEQEDGKIIIKCNYQEEGILFELLDQGITFDLSKVKAPNFSGLQDHGFGVFIAKNSVDSIAYQPKESGQDWNSLTLYKKYLKIEDSMKFSYEPVKDNILLVKLNNENLDAQESASFKESIVNLVTEKKYHNVIFDLHSLQFIDSSGLGSFLSILRVLNIQGGDLKLANMKKPIKTIFEIVRMHKLFEIYNSTDEAVCSFKG